jgi:endonuclease/exonuclease/phosphatase family metal-dependent hydrolase
MSAKRLRTLLFAALPLGMLIALLLGCGGALDLPTPAAKVSDGYLFCFWNVENFFDDKLSDHPNDADKKYDAWFANDPKALKHKLDNLSKALTEMNDGKGPDILALAEVESERAAELLKDALNARLKDPELHYKHVLMKEPKGFGRSIATAIITRLHVVGDKTRLHGKRQRILEGHVTVNGHDLVILATHWTSRVTDEQGEARDKYADQIYGVYRAMHTSNPKVDFLVCGDFNDPPDDDSVLKHLHGVGDTEKVKKSGGDEPLLYNLFLDKNDGTQGTHYYNRKWMIFDQIHVSPDMLLNSGGWVCDAESVKIVNNLTADKKGHPKRFGNPHDKIDLEERGYSDHFPVTVRLHVGVK